MSFAKSHLKYIDRYVFNLFSLIELYKNMKYHRRPFTLFSINLQKTREHALPISALLYITALACNFAQSPLIPPPRFNFAKY